MKDQASQRLHQETEPLQGGKKNTDTASALAEEIRRLKDALSVVILAHNYQHPEIYEIADFIGDSLELARQAQAVRAENIVFCGVRFMAETAKLLNPRAQVILAAPEAGCQMADMVSPEALRERKASLGEPVVLAYVNTSAHVKAESDVCCTSANAVRITAALPADRQILFVPDQNLASYVRTKTGRNLIAWPGFCYVHAQFTVADVQRARTVHPNAVIIVHPECRPDVIAAADAVASTSGMLQIAARFHEVVLGTESGMCHRIRRELPGTVCWPLRRTAICHNMKRTTLEDVRRALLTIAEPKVSNSRTFDPIPPVTVPDDVAYRARAALERMLSYR